MSAAEPAHEIVRLGAQGDGVALGPGGEIHIAHALPGETVRRDADGRTHLLGPANPGRRIEPLCPHFPACGGCAVQHMSDDLYRTWKGRLLADALAQRGIDTDTAPLQIVALRSRRRATLTGRWQDGRFVLGFHGPRSHTLEPVTACAVLRPVIVAAVPGLGALAARFCPRDAEIRLAVLAADNGLDVTLLSGAKQQAGRALAELARLATAAGVIRLTVDGALVLQLDPPSVAIAGVAVAPPPAAFLQATAEAEAMLGNHVVSGVAKARHVADLFAGLGTLSLALAKVARVAAFDSDAALLAALSAAHDHARGLKPIRAVRRDLFRDPLSPLELKPFDAVVLDPPRAGAKAQSEALARSQVQRVVMVSCNPATLARDLRILIDGGYRLVSATPIDQFLLTAHLEAVAVLARP